MSAESHPTACGHRLCSHAAPKYQQHISLRSLSTIARSVRPATARSWQNSRPLQLSIAATSSRGLEAWAGHQGPAQSCSALRTPGRSRCQAAAGKPRGRLIRASAARQRTVELQRGRTRRGTSLETGLGGHWCWAWESSRWRASLFFLLGARLANSLPRFSASVCTCFWNMCACRNGDIQPFLLLMVPYKTIDCLSAASVTAQSKCGILNPKP
jgi:hypothetical protein